jgi:hypothetical protein
VQEPLGIRSFVHLAYLDDSKSKGGRWQVLSAVIVQDHNFSTCELLSSVIVEDLMPQERIDKFEEFHTCELFGGFGVFEGIDQPKRFEAIERVLGLLTMPLAVVYGAVDSKLLSQELFGSANPIDIGFRICAEGINKWVSSRFIDHLEKLNTGKPGEDLELYVTNPHLGLLIMDDCDKDTKNTLQRSFRTLRPRVRPLRESKLSSIHDDMYFGDSRFSVGIQLAGYVQLFHSASSKRGRCC